MPWTDLNNKSLKFYDLNSDNRNKEVVDILNAKVATLEELDLSNNQLTFRHIQPLLTILKDAKNLRKINVSNNLLGKHGARLIGELLKYCENVQQLDISHNNIGVDGVESLAIYLQKYASLQRLDLSSNKLNDEAIKYIKSILNIKALSELNLGGNEFGLAGFHALLSALKENNTLKSLSLRSNKNKDMQVNHYKLNITEDIIEALSFITSLEKLDLTDTNLNSNDITLLNAKLNNNPKLLLLVENSSQLADKSRLQPY